MNKDLTVGNPSTVLWKFCLPLFGSIVFQQLYNIADSWVAGKFIGQNALAAVGNSYEITLIFIAFAFGCNIGCSVLVSQLFGAREYGDVKTAVSTAALSSSLVCLLLMLVGILGCDGLLTLINTPEEVFADSALYLDIYVWGLPFVFFYNIATGVFSALGDSKTPFIFLAVSSLSNIAVDILFVTAFKMGVAGVAWATFLCQGISCVLAVAVVIRRLKQLPSQGKTVLFSGDLLGRFVVIAIPSVLQQSFISVGNILIQSVINRFGTDIMAGYSASVKLNNLVITSFTTIGNGHFQLCRPESGCGQADTNSGRLPGGAENGVADLPAAGGAVLHLRPGADELLYGRRHGGRAGQRNAVFVDFVPLLLCGLRQAGGGRHSPGNGENAPVHGSDLYRPDRAGGAGLRPVGDGAGLHRHLVRMAHRLDGGDGHFHSVLQERRVEYRAGGGPRGAGSGECFRVTAISEKNLQGI